MKKSQFRVGFIGTGRISDLHAIEYLQNPRTRIVALCDQDAALAEQRSAAWRLEDARVFTEPEELLAETDVDLVEILLPHHLHLPVALKALHAGKIVSLQKPMCTSIEEANRLVDAVADSGLPFRVFEHILFHPPVARARRLVAEGAIGTPLSIRIKSNPGYGKSAWSVPASATRWRQNRVESGGGPLVFDDGHHKFALARHFMGDPIEVHAFIGRTHAADGRWLDAPSMVSFQFPGNRIGNYEVVYSPALEIATRHYAQDERVEITGTRGVLWINGGHGRLGEEPPVTVYRDGTLTTHSRMATGWEHGFILATRHFLDCLAEGHPAALTARDARQVLRFALAAEESGRCGRAVAVPPPV